MALTEKIDLNLVTRILDVLAQDPIYTPFSLLRSGNIFQAEKAELNANSENPQEWKNCKTCRTDRQKMRIRNCNNLWSLQMFLLVH